MFLPLTGVQRQVLITSCLYLVHISIGFTAAWSGPVIPKLRDLEQSPIPYLLTETQLSFSATVVYLGGIPGAIVMTWLSNISGRKPCMILGGVAGVLGYIILITTKNYGMLLAGRLVVSASTGTGSIMNLVYIGEIASPKIRGILLTLTGLFHTVGIMLMYAIGPFLSYVAVNGVGLALFVTYTGCLMLIPESPIFYALQDRNEEATEVLRYFGRSEDTGEMVKVKEEFTNKNTKKDWKELLSIRSNRKALFIVVGINILQHCSGVLAILFFSAAIFDMAGSSVDSNIAMIIVCAFQLLGSTITPLFIERTGRRIILCISSAVCSLSMFLLGLYFYLDSIENPFIIHIKWFPLVILIVFYIGYDSGLGIIPNAIIGEMFTTNVRSKGSTVAFSTSWLVGFAVTTVFGALLETVGGYVAFWFFSCTCAFTVVFTLIFVPETRGKTLLEIQESL